MSVHQANIYWLASYPKSGNTWVRAFLTALQSDISNDILDINALGANGLVAARAWLDDMAGFDTDELGPAEMDRLRAELTQWLSDTSVRPLYLKIHDRYRLLENHKPLVPATATKGVLYILRNPLDIAVSMAYQYSMSFDKSIQMLNSNSSGLNLKCNVHEIYTQQLIGNWSSHVRSWQSSGFNNLLLLRYEDLIVRPKEQFSIAASYLGLEVNESAILRAIDATKFDQLQALEENDGFAERVPEQHAFFRKGCVGNWQHELSSAQVQIIIDTHYEVMKAQGYLTDDGQPKDCIVDCNNPVR